MELFGIDSLGQDPIKTPMEAGRTRMRRQYTVRIGTMRWGRFYSAAEMALWRAFLINTLGDATSRFTMPIWDIPSRLYVTKTVMISDGLKGIQESSIGLKTQVQCILKVENL